MKWCWTQRIPAGELVLIGGHVGIGKTAVTYDTAAELTRGTLLGVFEGQPRSVIICATEDSWEHTVVPRLTAAGADLTRVYRADVKTSSKAEDILSLPDDIAALEEGIRTIGDVALIVLDPLLSRLAAHLDTHKDAEVRRALEPLVTLAHRTGATVIGIIHINKTTSGDPLNMLMGSHAFAAVPRAVLFCMVDPDDEDVRLLGLIKSNLGRVDVPTLRFRIEDIVVEPSADGDITSAKVEWLNETKRSIRDAVEDTAIAEAQIQAGKRTATSDDAADWLEEFLTQHGRSALSSLVKTEGKKAGYSKDALNRARKRLGILSEATKEFQRQTLWRMPEAESSRRDADPFAATATTAMTATTVPSEGSSIDLVQDPDIAVIADDAVVGTKEGCATTGQAEYVSPQMLPLVNHTAAALQI